MFSKFYSYSRRKKGLWRGHFSYNHNDGWRARWETELEIVWGKNQLLGFRLHLGNRRSETPIDFSIGFHWLAFFFSFNAPKLGKFCEWIGRGHKRDISLKVFGGQLWWKLWYNDAMGYDQYHKCDQWRRPKLWPWSRGRHKCRSWMCMRDGSIALNPLSAIWGSPMYNYITVEEDELLIEIGQFPDDEYMLEVKLEEVWLGREHGPRWVRRKKFMLHVVVWTSEEGVPIQNDDWKGDVALASSIEVGDAVYWRMEFDFRFKEWVMSQRERNGYRPPSQKRQIIHLEETYPGDLQDMAAKGEIPHFEETYSGNTESKVEIIHLKEDELGLHVVTEQQLDYDLEEDDPMESKPHWVNQPRDAKGRFLKIKNELEHSGPSDIYTQSLADSYIMGRISYDTFRSLFDRA